MSKSGDTYPHWKDAITNNDVVVNLRCAAKYIIWHGSYVLLAIAGLLIVGGAKVLGMSGANRVISHPMTTKIATGVFKLIVVLYLILFSGIVLYNIWLSPMLAVSLLGAVVVSFIIAVLVILIGKSEYFDSVMDSIKSGASSAGQKAVETPGVRRVYGNCPVSLDIQPKWFEKLFK